MVLPAPRIEVAAERVLLEQVFVNLLINAVHVTAPGGVIRVSCELSDGQSSQEVVVRVADQGCGISPEHLSRVFDPFFTTKPQGEGTGLGLSVVYMVINKLGGKIQVDSRPGEGTEFILTLPLKV